MNMDLRIFNGINLFNSLDEEQMQALSAHLVRRRFSKNVVIINEGDMTNSLYINYDPGGQ